MTRFEKIYEQVNGTIKSQSYKWEYNFTSFAIDRDDLEGEALLVLAKIIGMQRYKKKTIDEMAKIFVTSMKNCFRNLLKHHRRMEKHMGGSIYPDAWPLDGGELKNAWDYIKPVRPVEFIEDTVESISVLIKEALPPHMHPFFKDMMLSFDGKAKWGTPFRINELSKKYKVSKQAICKRIKRIKIIAGEVLGVN